MKKRSKIILAILFVVLAVASVTAVFASAQTEVEKPNLQITACTLSFDDSVYIMYAVPEKSAAGADVKILYFTEPKTKDSEYNKDTAIYCEEPIGKQNAMGELCYVFKNRHMNAKNMTDTVYARAYAQVDGVDYYSNLVKYSIYEYAYNMLGKATGVKPTAELEELLNTMLSYGAASQKYFKYNTDFLATDERIKITVAGGSFSDCSTKGFFKTGDTVTLTANLGEEGARAHWYNSAGEFITTADHLEITVGEANESYRVMLSDSFPISNAEDLLNIVNDPTEKYKLINDINLEGMNWTPFESFSGVLDGNGYKIYNFTLTENPDYSAVRGFIINNTGTIKNLTISAFDFSFTESYNDPTVTKVGILTADNAGTIENCTLEGESANYDITINNYNETAYTQYDYFGGFAGVNKGTISNCVNNTPLTIKTTFNKYSTKFSSDYSTYLYMGGFAGQSSGTITDCEANLTVDITSLTYKNHSYGDAFQYPFFGGLVGKNNWGTINGCTANIDITSSGSITSGKYGWADLDIRTAALVNHNFGTVENCIATGEITAKDRGNWLISGAVCVNSHKISNCYSSVDINIEQSYNLGEIAGIVGYNEANGKIYSSVYDGAIELKDANSYGYIVGNNSNGGTATDCYHVSSSTITKNGTAITPTDNSSSLIDVNSAYTESFFFNTLGWDKEIWSITEGNPPELN